MITPPTSPTRLCFAHPPSSPDPMDWSFDIECESEDDMLPQSNPQVVVNIPALTIPDLPTIDTTALLPLCSSPTPGPSTIADYIQV